MAVLVLIAAAIVVVWWFDVQRHPMRRCRACNGSKVNSGSTAERWGSCSRCGGKGAVRRFGAPPKQH